MEPAADDNDDDDDGDGDGDGDGGDRGGDRGVTADDTSCGGGDNEAWAFLFFLATADPFWRPLAPLVCNRPPIGHLQKNGSNDLVAIHDVRM